MGTITFGDKAYRVDTENFLSDFNEWDEDFARGMRSEVGITGGLSEDHWKIIHFIRDSFKRTGKCPLVYETCRTNRLQLQELKELFSAGYLRGACKLAGVTYREGYLDQSWVEDLAERITTGAQEDKTYAVNVRGFLINPDDWDKKYATYKAYEMKCRS